MGNNKTFNTVALCALIVAVAGLTIGFAAFTTSLTIQSRAEVHPGELNLDVVFSTSQSSAVNSAETVAPTVGGTDSSEASATDATLNATTISGLSASFTKPGQTATYSFYVYNSSQYTAYLNEILYNNASGTDPASFRNCQPGSGTSNYTDACDNIKVTVTVGAESDATKVSTYQQITSGINHSLASSTGEPVTVVISYEGEAIPDGDLTVTFGDIKLNYTSLNPSA